MHSDDELFANDHQRDHYKPLHKIFSIGEPIQNVILSRARKAIIEILGETKGRLLDVCCGTGCLSMLLSYAGNEVVGVDSSATMLNRAVNKRRASEFILLDATKMTFQKEFNGAVISMSLHEMKPFEREVTWQRMHEAVKRGGKIVAMDFAVSPKLTLYSWFVRGLLKIDEKRFRKINLAHYENYLQFLKEGGIGPWIKRRRENVEEERFYLGGNIGVIAVKV
jgi:ubiquinone/menaquinone biosynthesis C-methylase UbiE